MTNQSRRLAASGFDHSVACRPTSGRSRQAASGHCGDEISCDDVKQKRAYVEPPALHAHVALSPFSRDVFMSLNIAGTPPGHNNCYHFHASPKYRRAAFDGEMGQRLEVLLREKSIELGWSIHAFAVDGDHAHFIVEADASPSKIAFRLLGYASFALRKEFPELKEINDEHLWGGRQCKVIANQEHYDNAISYIGRHKRV